MGTTVYLGSIYFIGEIFMLLCIWLEKKSFKQCL